jgi:choline dehydrogenase
MQESHLHCDYLIIGGGASGNVLARLLSDNKHTSVIVLEAGNNDSENEVIRDSKYAEIEFGLEEHFYAPFFWQQEPLPNGTLVNATPENSVKVHCNLIVNPSMEEDGNMTETMAGKYTTGKTSGGSTSINGMQWVRGSKGYWKEVHKLLGDDWALHKTIERFKKLENYMGKTDCEKYRGRNGHIDVRQAPVNPTQVDNDFVQAITNATSCEQILDYNCPNTPIGPFTQWQLTQKQDGSRESSDTAFLFPDAIDQEGRGLKGRKLTYLFNTTALRITFDRNVATGVIALQGKPLDYLRINARKKVIVSAGVFSSELLQRSGVGPAPLLKCLDIPVVADNGFVGRNLKNHLIAPVSFTCDPNKPGTPPEDPLALYSAGAFLPAITKDTDPNRRGYQLIGAVPSPGIFSILVLALQPHSRGVINIQSSNPLTVSLVDNNYLGDENDVMQYMDFFKTYVPKIAAELTKIDPKYVLTAPTLDVIADDAKLEAYIKGSVDHAHHWSGSNAMSKSCKTGAVDPTGHVYGVENLIVADCSVLSIQPDGNTQSPAYLVGWTIAELLKEKC